MSLINKMLQDLDARRTEVSGAEPFGAQIRAVPERRRVHPAWWVALALAGLLAGVLTWVLLRGGEQHASPSQLPLKLDIDLNVVPPSVIQEPQAPATAVDAAAPIPSVDMGRTENAAGPDPVVSDRLPAQKTFPDRPASALEALKKTQTKVAQDIARDAVTAGSPSIAPPLVAGQEVPVQVNKQIKELTPSQRAENEYRKAAMLFQQGKTAEAISGFEQALQIDPRHAGARQTLIGVLLESKRQDEALKLAREGLDTNPAQPGLAMIMARLQLEKGEQPRAIETLERSLEYAGGRADYHAFLAALLQREERHKAAAEQYLLALQKNPQSGVWWMGLGISLQADKRLPEAQEAYKRAKASNSLSPELQAFVDGRLNQLQP